MTAAPPDHLPTSRSGLVSPEIVIAVLLCGAGTTAGVLLGSPALQLLGPLIAVTIAVIAPHGSARLGIVVLTLFIVGGRAASNGLGTDLPVVLAVAFACALPLRTEIGEALRSSAILRLLTVIAVLLTFAATLRLLLDLPTYGTLAVRDWLTYPALLCLPIGAGLAVALRDWTGRDNDLARIGLVASGTVVVLYVLSLTVGLSPTFIDFGNVGVAGAALVAHGLFTPSPAGRLVTLSLGMAGVVFGQGRMIYLVIGALVLLALLMRRRRTGTVTSMPSRLLLIVAATLSVTALLGVAGNSAQLQGRLGSISADSVVTQIGSIFTDDDRLAGSVGDRREWWAAVGQHLSDNPHELVTGRGFGPDLINGYRSPDGQLVRKPHNDYLESLARLGAGPALALVLLMAVAARRALTAARETSAGAFYLGWILAAAATAFAQPYLAYPHGVVPLAFFIGAMLVHSEGRRTA